MAYAIGPQLLDGYVLAVLSHGDAYGYILTQQVKGKLDISESTLYPVLRRLQRDGLLDGVMTGPTRAATAAITPSPPWAAPSWTTGGGTGRRFGTA